MPDNDLRYAINSIVELLRKTKIQQAISHFRTAIIRNEKTAAGEQLLSTSNELVIAFRSFGAREQQVCKFMHLERLGSAQYWRDIVEVANGLDQTRAEIVQLYSRIMFAANHLPGLIGMMGEIQELQQTKDRFNVGKHQLEIKLRDAGEKASDPDRISRTIDGLDMVYSACVSLSKKPTKDLSLLHISGNPDRHIVFDGDHDTINAVKAIIESIAVSISQIEDVNNFDPDQIVSKLPVFDDLSTLQKLGTFRKTETSQISESMHEGCLLIMESGVMLAQNVDPKINSGKVIALPVDFSKGNSAEVPPVLKKFSPPQVIALNSSAEEPVVSVKRVETQLSESPAEKPEKDESEMTPEEFYQNYLREKDKMLSTGDAPDQEKAGSPSLSKDSKSDALNELISDLNKITRN